MTKLLEKALEAVSKLPEDEQDSLATLIMEELASEERWQEAFSKSQGQLSDLADEAVAEFKEGKTKGF